MQKRGSVGGAALELTSEAGGWSEVKMPLGRPQSLNAWAGLQLPAGGHAGRQQVRLSACPCPQWETRMEFLAPSADLAQPQLLKTFAG